VRSSGLRFHQAPVARSEDREHDQAETERREACTDQVEPDPAFWRRVSHPAGEGEDAEHNHHLADEHPNATRDRS
jgi:hypothetical protein